VAVEDEELALGLRVSPPHAARLLEEQGSALVEVLAKAAVLLDEVYPQGMQGVVVMVDSGGDLGCGLC
jgi:predicted nuclease with RNAse H fold